MVGQRLFTGMGVVVLLVGLLVTVLALVLIETAEDRFDEADLAGRAATHVAALEDIGAAAVFQAEGTAALFEASTEVTPDEFEAFTSRALAPPVSKVSYAEARSSGGATPIVPGEETELVVTMAAGAREIGLTPGTSLDEFPDRLELIEETIVTGQPAVGTFVDIDGDDEPGDVLIVSAVRRQSGEAIGAVMTTVQLDEILENQIDRAGEGIDWSLLAESSGVDARPDAWIGPFNLAGETMWLAGIRESDGIGPLSWIVLAAGVGLSIAAAWIVQSLRVEQEARRSAEELRRSAADKDRFLAGIGHQLRTPLTAVVGMLDLVTSEAETLDADEHEEFLDTARLQAHRLAELIDRFLIAGRISVDTLTVLDETVDLRTVLAEAVQRVEKPDHVVVKFQLEDELCRGDALRVRQVLHSLIENACRHARSSVDVNVSSREGQVTIAVSNDGEHLSDLLSERLFEPFTTSTEDTQPNRLGIGLWIARELARRMGGSLEHDPTLSGTTFVLTLRPAIATIPIVPSQVPAVRVRGGEDQARAGRHQPLAIRTVVQPIVDLAAGEIVGYEALTRGERGESWWELQEREPPVVLQRAAISNALDLAATRPSGTFIGINLDTPLVAASPIVECLRLAGELSGVVIELTDHYSGLSSETLAVVASLRERGAMIAVDDFGAGRHGLQRLNALRPEVVKLDGRLTDRLRSDPGARAVLDTVGELADRFDARVIAEKVENQGQLEILAEHQIQLAQGFLFGSPGMPWPSLDDSAKARLRSVAGNFGEVASIAGLIEAIGEGSDPRRNVLMDPQGRVLALQDGETLVSSPTVVLASDSLRTVLRQALGRPAPQIFVPLVAVDGDGVPLGVITVERLTAAVSGLDAAWS